MPFRAVSDGFQLKLRATKNLWYLRIIFIPLSSLSSSPALPVLLFFPQQNMEHVAIHCHPTLIHPILIPQHAIPNPQTPMPTWYHSRICTFPQNMEHSSTFIIHIDPYSSNIHTSNPQSSTPNPQSPIPTWNHSRIYTFSPHRTWNTASRSECSTSNSLPRCCSCGNQTVGLCTIRNHMNTRHN